jgi:hypothetical protein
MSTQKEIQNAFRWVLQVYQEAGALLEDAQRMAEGMGYRTRGGVLTAYTTVLRVDELPFVYLAVVFLAPEGRVDEESGQTLFLAIDFNSGFRTGPYLLLGVVRHTSFAKVNTSVINETARRLGGLGYFATKKPMDGSVTYVHTPVGKYKGYAGVDEVRHVEIPLTFVDSPEKLRSVLEGGTAILEGNEGPAKVLIEESRATAG